MDENILTYVVLVIVIIGCLYVYFENNDFDLKCIVSSVDGNKYCVRERSKLKEASNLLAAKNVKTWLHIWTNTTVLKKTYNDL